MNKSIIVVLAGGALAIGAFWIGRSTDDARAESPSAPSPLTSPLPPTPTERAAVARPSLPTRQPARGLAADLVAADPKIRKAAIVEAAQGDADPQVMLAASRDPDGDVARTAIASLNGMYAAGQVETKEMIAVAADRSIPDRVRLLALNGVGTVPNPDAAAMLVKMLASGTITERRTAAALLGNQDVELAVPALIAALSDADEYVRSQAADSLKLRSRGRDFGFDAGAWQAWWQQSKG